MLAWPYRQPVPVNARHRSPIRPVPAWTDGLAYVQDGGVPSGSLDRGDELIDLRVSGGLRSIAVRLDQGRAGPSFHRRGSALVCGSVRCHPVASGVAQHGELLYRFEKVLALGGLVVLAGLAYTSSLGYWRLRLGALLDPLLPFDGISFATVHD